MNARLSSIRRAPTRHRAWPLLLATALLTISAAHADDTEVFLGDAYARGLRPNILFIIDTSGSMNSLVTLPKPPYDPATTYTGNCLSDEIYYSTSTGNDGAPLPPACSEKAANHVPVAANSCAAATVALGSTAGQYAGRVLQWSTGGVAWRAIAEGSTETLECEADAGIHGETQASGQRYARNGDTQNHWTASANEQISWSSADVIALYGANWLNWYYTPGVPTNLTRLQTVQSVATSLANSIDRVNLGLMRFSNTPGPNTGSGPDLAEGGMIAHEVANISTARAGIVSALGSYTADGFTPLSETLYEAGQYWAGRNVDYGLQSRIDAATPFPSVAASRRSDDPAAYQSPTQFQCQRNYNILLTDGEPTMDQSADNKITNLPGFAAAVGGSCDGSGDGHCLDDMAAYLNKADLSPLPGKQNVITYTIGFGPEVVGSSFLTRVAQRGGGRAYTAGNLNELTTALQSIVNEIQRTSSTFASPSVSVNAFNRTQTNNELYVSVFKPTTTQRWPGNVKKYALSGGNIVDATGRSAVDASTGFFRSDSQSIWSASPDGDDVSAGGAVSRMPAPASRRLFTWIESAGNRNLTATTNAFAVENPLVTDALLNTSAAGAATRENVINFFRGQDLSDLDGDGIYDEVVPHMGDPLHAKPAVVTFGGSASNPDARDSVLFVPTNDGFLHAIDAKTGRELWAFIPSSLLGRLPGIFSDRGVSERSYGLDGDVRVLKFDANSDGIIDRSAGDRVWIYFGMRRGGREYFALDVTDRDNPRIKFVIGPQQLPGIGETWSTPALARVRVSGATQNGENLVLIFGGGYDDAEENTNYVEDTSGHRVYMVDASSGALLWYAGGPRGTGTPDLALDRMRNAIPGRIVVLDTDADGYADRLYAGDLGGRVWRFDITNGNSRGSLVTGGVLAKLGAGDNTDQSVAANRRFYNAPDVALIQRRGAEPYYSVAIGSGYRGHPLNTVTRDRFYLLRDKNPFRKLSAGEYTNFDPIEDGDVIDITTTLGNSRVPPAAAGWKLELRLNGGWVGEKILSEALTVDGTVLFTTYQPQAAGTVDPCQPANGINRAYALRLDEGRAALDLNDDKVLDARDVSQALAQTGIAGEVSLAMESTAGSSGNQDANKPPVDALGRRTLCVVGVEVLKHCVAPGGVVRTFWERKADGAN